MSGTTEDWLRQGVDLWMIRENLRLSPEGRVAQHQDTLRTIESLKAARDQHRARPAITPQAADPKRR